MLLTSSRWKTNYLLHRRVGAHLPATGSAQHPAGGGCWGKHCSALMLGQALAKGKHDRVYLPQVKAEVRTQLLHRLLNPLPASRSPTLLASCNALWSRIRTSEGSLASGHTASGLTAKKLQLWKEIDNDVSNPKMVANSIAPREWKTGPEFISGLTAAEAPRLLIHLAPGIFVKWMMGTAKCKQPQTRWR